MRDHHAGRGSRERVQVEGDVALSQWHREHTPVPITLASLTLTWLSLRSATSSAAPSSANQSSLSAFRDRSQDGSNPSSSAATRSVINYHATDFLAPGPGKLPLVFTPGGGGEPVTSNVYDFKGKGFALAMYNTGDVCPCFFLLVF